MHVDKWLQQTTRKQRSKQARRELSNKGSTQKTNGKQRSKKARMVVSKQVNREVGKSDEK